LLQLAEQGKLRADDLLWKPGYESWQPANAVPGLLTPPSPVLGGDITTSLAPQRVEATKQRLFDALRRLWRGQQPLWKAFWLFFALGSVLILVLALAVYGSIATLLQKMGFGDSAFVPALVLTLVTALSYDIFAAVGAWRSASWSSVWGVLARPYIVLALFMVLLKLGGLLAFALKSAAVYC
jgi:hypothetical protein